MGGGARDRRTAERLTALETRFLQLEDPLIIVGVMIFAEGETVVARPTLAQLRDLLAQRAASIDQLHLRIRKVPGNLAPPVLEKVALDLDDHLSVWREGQRTFGHGACDGAPGTREVTRSALIEIAAEELRLEFDLDRPPWRVLFVPAVERGRFAVIASCHHVLTDAVGGLVMVLASLLDVEPRPAARPAPDTDAPPPVHSDAELARGALWWHGQRWARTASLIWRSPRAATALRGPASSRGLERAATLLAIMARRRRRLPAPHPFSVPSGQGVKIVAWDGSMSDLRELARPLGATFNDVLLSSLAGAIRRWHAHQGTDPADVRCSFPIRITEPADGARRNPTVRVFVDLPVSEAEPLARLRKVALRTSMLKAADEAHLVEGLELFAEHAPGPLRRRILAALYQNESANLVSLSNFPGVPFAVYLLGWPLTEMFPLVTLTGTYRLAVVVTSVLDRAFMTCAVAGAVPDGESIAESMQSELQLLRVKQLSLTAIRAVPLLASASAEQLDHLATAAQELTLRAGTTVFELGQPPDFFYVIKNGTLTVDGPGVHRRLTAPEWFGEVGPLTGEPRSATVQAESDVTLLRLHRDEFVPAVLENPVARRVAEGLVAAVQAQARAR